MRQPQTFNSIRLALLVCVCLCFRLIISASCFFIDKHQSPPSSAWSYEQQMKWPKLYKSCSLRAQSPIDIQHKNVIQSGQLKMHFYNYKRLIKFRLTNAHHSIKLDPLGRGYQHSHNGQPHSQSNGSLDASIHDIISVDEYVDNYGQATGSDNSNQADDQGQMSSKLMASKQQQQPAMSLGARGAQRSRPAGRLPMNNEEDNAELPYDGAPAIKLDWLDDGNNEFKLRDIHFHWGEWRDNGSEHAIDGRRAAMEMHLVHIKHKLDKSKIGFTSDSVVVIAVLIESHRKSYADFNPIVNALTSINRTDKAQEVEYKSINDLLPNDMSSFYTYSGSLTTPPCYEVVNWIVMSETVNMNLKQIELFRNLYSPDTLDDNEHGESNHHGPKLIVPNIRSLQPLNNRTILASFPIPGTNWGLNVYNSASTSPSNQMIGRRNHQAIRWLMATLSLIYVGSYCTPGSLRLAQWH